MRGWRTGIDWRLDIMVAKTSKKKDPITKDMTLGDVVQNHPETIETFLGYGLHCVGCHVAYWETIEQGAMAHGITGKKFDALMKDLNKVVKKQKVTK
jgi:hybrid cluster-associated redox disulfide protein